MQRASSASANPLSDVSVASMGDLGYVVNLGTGDRYRLPRTTSAVVAANTVAGGPQGLDLKGPRAPDQAGRRGALDAAEGFS